jgi:hypothetical protein
MVSGANSGPIEDDSPNMGDHVWLMTSKQTEPLLDESTGLELRIASGYARTTHRYLDGRFYS